MFRLTDDLRIERLGPLIPPAILMEQHPLTGAASTTVAEGREAASRILRGEDDRLLVVIGPCSIHDVAAARDYGQRLRAVADQLAADLLVVMRVYFEKPRIANWTHHLLCNPVPIAGLWPILVGHGGPRLAEVGSRLVAAMRPPCFA